MCYVHRFIRKRMNVMPVLHYCAEIHAEGGLLMVIHTISVDDTRSHVMVDKAVFISLDDIGICVSVAVGHK